MRALLLIFVASGSILLYLLSLATNNTTEFARHFPLLLIGGGILSLLLLALIVYQLIVLRRKLKSHVFGAKLTLRLMWMFALMALIPSILVFGMSVQFLRSSIETWFNVRVEHALKGGLNLGQSALDNMRSQLIKKADSMAYEISIQPRTGNLGLLRLLREQNGVTEATLFDAHDNVLAFSSNNQTKLLPDDLLNDFIMRQIRQQQPYSEVQYTSHGNMLLRVVVPVNVLNLHEDIRALQLIEPVPQQLAKDADTVQAGYRNYQELVLSRLGLKRLFGLSLTITLLLGLFSALAFAFLMSERLSAPLSLLAEGTKAVAKGDFSRIAVKSRDELGLLMRSFNSMTRQLSEAHQATRFHQEQLETAKSYLESILSNLSSGVMAFDENYLLRTINPAAKIILNNDFSSLAHQPFEQWTDDPAIGQFAREVYDHFEKKKETQWEHQLTYHGEQGNQVLLIRGTRLPNTSCIVVFDDITHLLQAQRNAAWGEVARRLAHEIKNPLTPIQLSAEHLAHKLSGKLGPDEAEMLNRAIITIVNQVNAMKAMVDDFSDYARMRKPDLKPLNLNNLIEEVLSLYEPMGINIITDLDADLGPILGDITLLRQLIHNLLKNSQNALIGKRKPQIRVSTHRAEDKIILIIEDNGIGFPKDLIARAFEPYVTTNPKGMGLGLAVVKKIVEEHNGNMRIENVPPHGAKVSVILEASGVTK
ncbi:MAG: HAMP domain-containing protein [Pseudomonadota bacterium]|nr:HAMP domain-containing protein [Pseudomonadota bacterium]